jgi:hypothetical protein
LFLLIFFRLISPSPKFPGVSGLFGRRFRAAEPETFSGAFLRGELSFSPLAAFAVRQSPKILAVAEASANRRT